MDKLQIARNLEYVAGGIDTVKHMCTQEKDKYFASILSNWEEWIFDALDMIMEDDEEDASYPRRTR